MCPYKAAGIGGRAGGRRNARLSTTADRHLREGVVCGVALMADGPTKGELAGLGAFAVHQDQISTNRKRPSAACRVSAQHHQLNRHHTYQQERWDR
ncbi:hypothetical protein IMZ48_42180 [Candidatus Bathyarchaeota archaeon]|nr:hypothetical protein [Candidatus Bathyarchaeota archaeon]